MRPTGLTATEEMFDLRISPRGAAVRERLIDFIETEVVPASEEYALLGHRAKDRWALLPEQLSLLGDLTSSARDRGLWNLFLADDEGLSNLDYAYIAAELFRADLAAEAINCAPPDTGNMEVLRAVGTPAQRECWLDPLMAGEIRSGFAMTEPGVASSDANAIATTARLEDGEWVINGEKFFISGTGDPRCAVLIVMALTEPDAPRGRRHSQILVPTDTPGLEFVEPMSVFGWDHAPYGHMHLRFDDVRVPEANVLLGRGRGFEISQLRLSGGRIHICMRAIGAAERALELMVARAVEREAFGQRLVDLGRTRETIARARIEIEAMRMLVLKAAKAMDVLPRREASVWISAAKAHVPRRVCEIIDDAIQVYGAAGLSQWTPLAHLWAMHRVVRISDGPDEVHYRVVSRAELNAWQHEAERR
jgi:acyl-CoA dehydrogenase